MKRPVLSVIIPWCNRQELPAVIEANKSVFDKHDLEVIIANVGGDTQMIRNVVRPGVRICQILSCKFNKSMALNLGVHVSNADNLFFLDTDILLTEDFLSSAMTVIQDRGTVVVDKVLETAMLNTRSDDNDLIEEIVTYLEVRAKNGRRAIIQNRRDSFTHFNRVGNGLIFVSKKDFLAVDGMNSGLAGWGFEDDDFLLRLQLGAGLRATAMGTVTHLTHDNRMRDLNGQSVEEQIKMNYTIAVQRYKAGNYRGSYTSDMEKWAGQFEIVGQ